MKTHLAPVILVAVLLGLYSSAGAALDWIDEDELADSCEVLGVDSNTATASVCIAYVQGFLAGNDTRPATRVLRAPPQDEETLKDRALRTRLGARRQLRLRSATGVDYCFDEESTAAEVVVQISDYLREQSHDAKLTDASNFREALISVFPCES